MYIIYFSMLREFSAFFHFQIPRGYMKMRSLFLKEIL